MISFLLRYLQKGLFQLILHPTLRCNFRCVMCFNRGNLTESAEDELSVAGFRKISRTMPSFPWLMISGGEPFLREDLSEIVAVFCEGNNVRHITISTNGSLADSVENGLKAMLSRFPRTSFNLALSLDGLKGDQDRIRGTRNSFNRLIEMYERAPMLRNRHSNFTIKINTVLADYNWRNLHRIREFVRSLEPDMHSIDFVRPASDSEGIGLPPLEELGDLASIARDTAISYSGYRTLNAHIAGLKTLSKTVHSAYYNLFLEITRDQVQPIPCYAGRANAVLYPQGNLAFCELLEPIGNLRDEGYDFEGLWRNQRARSLRRDIALWTCVCYHPCYQLTNLLYRPSRLLNLGWHKEMR